MELTNEKIIQAKKFNSKIFPIYKLFAWDLLFYYSISFLFLTQNKGLSASQVLFAEAFYPIFKLVSQIPCVNIIEIIGKRKSLILGNISVALGILFLILGSGISSAIIFNIITAFGYSIKGIGEATILSDFVQDEEHPRTAYADLDGKGSSYWYCFDGITAFFCGFLYVFNNYLPIILSLVSAMIGALIKA